MTGSALKSEIEAGVNFWGWEEAGALAGVMGIQQVRDATLIRHAYVRTAHQGRGIGGAAIARRASLPDGRGSVLDLSAGERSVRGVGPCRPARVYQENANDGR